MNKLCFFLSYWNLLQFKSYGKLWKLIDDLYSCNSVLIAAQIQQQPFPVPGKQKILWTTLQNYDLWITLYTYCRSISATSIPRYLLVSEGIEIGWFQKIYFSGPLQQQPFLNIPGKLMLQIIMKKTNKRLPTDITISRLNRWLYTQRS